MNPSTTRAQSPATTGKFAAALPNDEGIDAILADPNLSATAKLICVALIRHWAWYKDHCWPSDQTIAAKLGKSVGHVQRCLQELEQAGLIRRERTSATGRLIWLLWRCPAGCHATIPAPQDIAQPVPAPARIACPAPARDERKNSSERKQEPLRNVTDCTHPPRATIATVSPQQQEEPAPAPPAARVAPSLPLPASQTAPVVVPGPATPPLSLPEAIKVLPGSSPQHLRSTANRLAQALNDYGSLGCYLSLLAQVVACTVPVERAIVALEAGLGAVKSGARRSGAIFVWAWRNWQPAPKFSEINRPVYYQAPVPVSNPPTHDKEAELRELQIMASDPRHPFQKVAQQKLAELS